MKNEGLNTDWPAIFWPFVYKLIDNKIGKSILKTNSIKKSNLVNEEDIYFKYNNYKIKEILDKNNFPQNYSFFEELNIYPKIKTQSKTLLKSLSKVPSGRLFEKIRIC